MSYKFIFKAFSLLCLFLSQFIYSQDDFFYLDYGLFKGSENKAIIELYYSFDQKQLQFVSKENGYEAAGKILLKINQGKQTIVNESFNIPVSVQDTAGYNRNNRLIGQLNLMLDSGNYFISVVASDMNNESAKYIDTVSFRLSRFAEDKLSSSSIQLANNIVKSEDKNNIFYKNNLEVEPNPSRLFGNNISRLFYYIEFYNLIEDLLQDKYQINTSLVNSDGTVLKENKKDYKRTHDSKVEIGSFDLSDFPSGKYAVKTNLLDNKGSYIELIKPFYIYNSSVTNNQVDNTNPDIDFLSSEIHKMSKEELMDDFSKAKYITDDNFKEKFESLNDLEAQKRLYYNFWRALDPTPKTPFNELRKEYFEKVQYADKYYKTINQKGWDTDRGRVYISYGKPSEIEKFPFEANSKAYEIWRYDNIEGGVEFVFIDIQNDGTNYELVHSTKKNELRNDNWQQKLKEIR